MAKRSRKHKVGLVFRFGREAGISHFRNLAGRTRLRFQLAAEQISPPRRARQKFARPGTVTDIALPPGAVVGLVDLVQQRRFQSAGLFQDVLHSVAALLAGIPAQHP